MSTWSWLLLAAAVLVASCHADVGQQAENDVEDYENSGNREPARKTEQNNDNAVETVTRKEVSVIQDQNNDVASVDTDSDNEEVQKITTRAPRRKKKKRRRCRKNGKRCKKRRRGRKRRKDRKRYSYRRKGKKRGRSSLRYKGWSRRRKYRD